MLMKKHKKNSKKKISVYLGGVLGVLASILAIILLRISHKSAQNEEQPVTYEAEQEAEKESEQESDHELLPEQESTMSVHYIDVGQGDCTLVICDGHAMLIDAGNNSKGTLVQGYLMALGVQQLEYVIGTHPDSDHIGGLDQIITKYNCGTILMPERETDQKTYLDVIQAMDQKGYRKTVPQVLDVYTLGSATFTVLGPSGGVQGHENDNNECIAILLRHGENTFLFTGDAEKEEEEAILSLGVDIRAKVYQAGHHGSHTSNGETFLQAVEPEYVVISCGEGNDYGHPHIEVLEAVKAIGAEIYRTDKQGSIVAVSDMTTIQWSLEPYDNVHEQSDKEESEEIPEAVKYIGNKRNNKLHLATCEGLPQTQNQIYFESLEEAENAGFTKENQCQRCMPFDR